MSPLLSGTDLIHADQSLAGYEVAPSISVSTTFRRDPLYHDDVDEPPVMLQGRRHVYSTYSQDVSDRDLQVLNKVLHGYSMTYSSGLAAAYAALVHYNPKRVAIRKGYMGCHGCIRTYSKAKSEKIVMIDLDDDFQEGDLCWLETPLNPTGESRDIAYYAKKVHAVGGKILVDSTFGPPPLQDPFKWGADCVFHSGTKYFGGHSDLLCGILAVKTEAEHLELWDDRKFMGNVMGSLETWLLLRSLRTLHLRIPRQSATATTLAQWLAGAVSAIDGQEEEYDGIPRGVVTKVWHSSLQSVDERGFDPAKQMEGGFGAAFSIRLAHREYADRFPHYLQYFVVATSLGGVESLVEQRVRSDKNEDPLLIRFSIGVEDVDDLQCDLRQAFQRLTKIELPLAAPSSSGGLCRSQ